MDSASLHARPPRAIEACTATSRAWSAISESTTLNRACIALPGASPAAPELTDARSAARRRATRFFTPLHREASSVTTRLRWARVKCVALSAWKRTVKTTSGTTKASMLETSMVFSEFVCITCAADRAPARGLPSAVILSGTAALAKTTV